MLLYPVNNNAWTNTLIRHNTGFHVGFSFSLGAVEVHCARERLCLFKESKIKGEHISMPISVSDDYQTSVLDTRLTVLTMIISP